MYCSFDLWWDFNLTLQHVMLWDILSGFSKVLETPSQMSDFMRLTAVIPFTGALKSHWSFSLVQGDSSGDYRKILLELCGGEWQKRQNNIRLRLYSAHRALWAFFFCLVSYLFLFHGLHISLIDRSALFYCSYCYSIPIKPKTGDLLHTPVFLLLIPR